MFTVEIREDVETHDKQSDDPDGGYMEENNPAEGVAGLLAIRRVSTRNQNVSSREPLINSCMLRASRVFPV